MTAVKIAGIEALRRRFEAASAPEPFKSALREEAEAIGAEARREAPAVFAQAIAVEDVSQGRRSPSPSARPTRPAGPPSSAR